MGETRRGKTTQIPQFLLDSGLAGKRCVLDKGVGVRGWGCEEGGGGVSGAFPVPHMGGWGGGAYVCL